MTDSVYKVECEWDIGQDRVIFGTYEAAENWARVQSEKYISEYTFEDLFSENLIDIEMWKLIYG